MQSAPVATTLPACSDMLLPSAEQRGRNVHESGKPYARKANRLTQRRRREAVIRRRAADKINTR